VLSHYPGKIDFYCFGCVTSSLLYGVVNWEVFLHLISCRRSIVTKSLSPAVSEIMATKHIGVMTLTFQGHVTSSVTWPLDSRLSISYWWSFGPNSLSLTVSEIFRPKHRHCVCAYHVTCTTYVKFKYIFEFLTPTLPIHYVTFIRLRWRIRGVLSVTSNVKAKSSEKFLSTKICEMFTF